jgi:hypothetical protein
MKRVVVVLAFLMTACVSSHRPAIAVSDPGIEAAVQSVYDAISGPMGTRDWDHFRTLFAPGARLIVVRNGEPVVMTTDDFVARVTPNVAKNGFFERSLFNRVERYGDIAHVFSTYESRHATTEAPFARGINSFQLVRVNNRWLIETILWQSEDAQHPIPPEYLP